MPLRYAIEVLTDGSELSGSACLLLAVYRQSTLVARYALSGLPDATARISADQRIALHSIQAVFGRRHALDGVPAWLIAGYEAGCEAVTVVSDDERLEERIQLVVGHHAHPTVKVCTIADAPGWFQVYQDRIIEVHAYYHQSSMAYIYTLLDCGKTILVVHEHTPIPTTLPRDRVIVGICLECDAVPLSSSNLPSSIATRWFTTLSTNQDARLLVRARQQAQAWHAADAEHFEWLETNEKHEPNHHRLRTGATLWLDTWQVDDRTLDLLSSSFSSADRDDWPSRYDFDATVVYDENEIDLDDATTMRLVCLGTGCAKPSPYRGASAYALLCNESSALVLEAGEGFVLQWQRHVAQELLSIRAIWISHAHFDHYGGLVPLLSAMHAQRQSSESKRSRVEVPLVIANDKVLKFLRLSFDKPSDYYQSISTSRDRPRAAQALVDLYSEIMAFENVPVDHGCADAFGFVMGLQGGDQPFILCFSGDTKPCQRLLDACRRHARLAGKECIDLLLHEATFHGNEQALSGKKNHSTVSDVLAMAKELRPGRTVLTHFSQRYDSPPEQDFAATDTCCFPAFDGLLITLY